MQTAKGRGKGEIKVKIKIKNNTTTKLKISPEFWTFFFYGRKVCQEGGKKD